MLNARKKKKKYCYIYPGVPSLSERNSQQGRSNAAKIQILMLTKEICKIQNTNTEYSQKKYAATETPILTHQWWNVNF